MERIDGISIVEEMNPNDRASLCYRQIASLNANLLNARTLLGQIEASIDGLAPAWAVVRAAVNDASPLIGSASAEQLTDALRGVWERGSTDWPENFGLSSLQRRQFYTVAKPFFLETPTGDLMFAPLEQLGRNEHLIRAVDGLDMAYRSINLNLQ
jgi:hypothetical protein